MNKRIGMALLLAGSLGAAGVAGAASGSTMNVEAMTVDGFGTIEVRSLSVPYDTGMQDDQSAKKLFFRIRQAAAEVCSIAANPVGYELWEEHACEKEAVAEAIQLADIPALDAYYVERAGGSVARR
jgi:UrcA family protein